MRHPSPPCRRHRTVAVLAVFAAVACWPVAPGRAQPPDAAEDGTLAGSFAEAVDVNVVNVEVRVTDREGKPVTDLERGDFELRIGDEVAPISHFVRVDRRRDRPGVPTPLPPEATDAPAPAAAGERRDQRVNLVVYVDNRNAREVTRNRALGHLRNFLRGRLRPGDRAMVVTYDQMMSVRQPLTGDLEAVISALFAIEDLPSHRRSVDRMRREILDDIYQAEDIGEVSGRSRQYAEMVYGELEGVLDGLAGLVDSLAGLPGRTAVLYVSDGVPMTAGEDVFVALADRFPADVSSLVSRDYDASRRFRVIASQANAHGVTLYTVDASGLRPYGNADVESYQAEIGSVVESTHVANLQDPLFLMANDTGGQVIANTNLIAKGLDEIGDDFDSYYSLATTFGGTGSGRYHSIEVTVPGRRDLRIRHREGFRDKRAESRMAESTLAALHYGAEVDDLGVGVSFATPQRRGEAVYVVPMVVEIPMSRLVFVPRQDIQVSRVQLYVSAEDADGTASPVEQVRVPIEIPAAKMELAMEHNYRLQHQLLMGPGRHRVAVGVRDELGVALSVVVTTIDVTPAGS